MQRSGQDYGAIFARSWELLSSNWIIIVPGIVIGVIAGALVGVLFLTGIASGVVLGAAGAVGAGIMSALLASLLVAVVLAIATLISVAYTSGMAAAAWRTGTTTLADGAAAFRGEGASIFAAMMLLFLIGCVAIVLSRFTLFLSVVAFAIFFLYVIPSVVVDNVPATEAIGRSCRLVLQNFLPTLIIVLIIGVISALGSWIGHLFSGLPLLGLIFQYGIQQAVVAYGMLVAVGQYIAIKDAGIPVAVRTTPGTWVAPTTAGATVRPDPSHPEVRQEAVDATAGDRHLDDYDKADADSFPASDPPVQP